MHLDVRFPGSHRGVPWGPFSEGSERVSQKVRKFREFLRKLESSEGVSLKARKFLESA